jgi:hypothetical protein
MAENGNDFFAENHDEERARAFYLAIHSAASRQCSISTRRELLHLRHSALPLAAQLC